MTRRTGPQTPCTQHTTRHTARHPPCGTPKTAPLNNLAAERSETQTQPSLMECTPHAPLALHTRHHTTHPSPQTKLIPEQQSTPPRCNTTRSIVPRIWHATRRTSDHRHRASRNTPKHTGRHTPYTTLPMPHGTHKHGPQGTTQATPRHAAQTTTSYPKT